MLTHPRRYSERVISSNSDEVLAAWPIPPGGGVSGINLECHVIGAEETLATKLMMYGIGAWVIPISDLDNTSHMDTLWDKYVPKDEAESEAGFDLDETADTQPEFAAGGEIDWNDVFELTESSPKEIFRRRKMISVASSPIGYNWVTGTGTDTFTPTDHFKTRIRKPVRVRQASILLIGFSSPVFDQTRISTADVLPTQQQWQQLAFLDRTLDKALDSAIGLTSTGTQESNTEALAWISQYLEPDIVEDTAGAFADMTYTVGTRAAAQIMVPKKDISNNLSGQ